MRAVLLFRIHQVLHEVHLEGDTRGFKHRSEVGLFGFPAGQGAGADSGGHAGGAVGDTGGLDDVADGLGQGRVIEGGATARVT